jgi:F-type H+-transporting ATPase subunit a
MLPFQLISEVSRTLSLAVRLFGNIMSGSMLVAILLSIVPLLFPMVMRAFGLLIGMIQAYVFAILAMVYIASGMRAQKSS